MTTLLVFTAILVFVAGLVVGFVEGWNRGARDGYHVGWMSANSEIRRIMGRAKGETE